MLVSENAHMSMQVQVSGRPSRSLAGVLRGGRGVHCTTKQAITIQGSCHPIVRACQSLTKLKLQAIIQTQVASMSTGNLTLQGTEQLEGASEPSLPIHSRGWAGAAGVRRNPLGPPPTASQQSPNLCSGYRSSHRGLTAPDWPSP